MKKNRDLKYQKAQKRYRKSQASKGLVRYEIQISQETKQKFEEMVKAIADEYAEPYSEIRRMALARKEVFDQITQGSLYEFHELKQRIKSLEEEIDALAPKFFSERKDNSPLPSAIKALPDDSGHLKTLLSKFFSEGQQAKREAKEYKRRAEQYEELYRVVSDHCDELERRA